MPEEPESGESISDLTPTLVARLRQGDSRSGEILTEVYRPLLQRFCFRYLGNRDEAEDVVQEVFLRVLRDSASPANFRAWIYKIARNRCLDVMRARERRRDDQELPTASHLDAELTGNLTRMVRKEQQKQLLELLAELPESHREILQLRYTEDLARNEIADVMDLSESVVKSRLYESLVKLRGESSILNPD